MKSKIAIIILLLSSLWANAQIKFEQVSIEYPEVVDTIPSWIVYVDSVRMFAGAPDYDLRLEVAPGWVVRRKVFAYTSIETFETYYDTSGIQFNSDIVLFTNRRKVVYNKFRQ